MTARRYEWIVILIAAAIFLGCIVSPPALMDDVDSVQASLAHTMVETGDWVTPHLDGVKYFEKPPLKYWMIAVFFELFGVHDWARAADGSPMRTRPSRRAASGKPPGQREPSGANNTASDLARAICRTS